MMTRMVRQIFTIKLLVFLFFLRVLAETQTNPDSLLNTSSDSLEIQNPDSQHVDTVFNDGTIEKRDSLLSKEGPNSPDSISEKSSLPSPAPEDSVKHTGLFIGAGAGWTLGSFTLLDLWKQSLPDSLGDFGLDANSFAVEGDSSSLKFVIKKDADYYNMTFPIKVSFHKIREKDFFSSALSFSMIRKGFKASVFPLKDSLEGKVDIRQNLSLYSLGIEFLYGFRIQERYFSIDGVDRSDFIIGAGISPLVSLQSINKADLNSDDPRMVSVKESIHSFFNNHKSFGLALTLRTGLSTMKSFGSRGAIETGIFYTLNWYRRFFSSGKEVLTSDAFPESNDNEPLSCISNRLEISFSLLRNVH
jgi:hypothetical protein